MGRTYEIVTPEQVAIRYELAGFGSRAAAAMLDTLCILLLLTLQLATLSLLVWLKVVPTVDTWKEAILFALALIVLFGTFWTYYIAFETLWHGETPGKRWMGLRVIKDGGHPVDFRAAVTRNLLRAVDMLPGVPVLPSYVLALVVLVSNPDYKRLGDLAAGTLVVRHGQEKRTLKKRGFGDAVTYRLLDATLLTQLNRLTREEYRMVQRFVERRHALAQPLRGEFARRLALPLMEKFAYTPPALGLDYERWLEELHLAFRTRAISGGIFVATAVSAKASRFKTRPAAPSSAPPFDGRRW
jgi:uncharacterized RDD family membrane protein YckC